MLKNKPLKAYRGTFLGPVMTGEAVVFAVNKSQAKRLLKETVEAEVTPKMSTFGGRAKEATITDLTALDNRTVGAHILYDGDY